jgi:hypothetical protein
LGGAVTVLDFELGEIDGAQIKVHGLSHGSPPRAVRVAFSVGAIAIG